MNKCNHCGKEFVEKFVIENSRYLHNIIFCPECCKIKEVERIEQQAKEIQQRINQFKIMIFGGVKILDLTFDKFVVNESNKEVFKVMQNFDYKKDNIYIYGRCGTGKTMLAGAILSKFIDLDVNTLFFNLFSLSRSLRMKEPDEESELLKKYINSNIFILDDLGVGKTTDFGLQILYEIIDGRDKNNKNGLIITSNFSLEEISQKLDDDRLASRIAGLCHVYELKGKDYRIK